MRLGDQTMLGRWWPRLQRKGVILIAICGSFVTGCASIQGYPRDPEDSAATLARLTPYFDGSKENEYNDETDSASRERKRNEIVFARMRGYDIEFADFQRQLYGFANSVSVGTDLIGLVLGGLTATTGNASTKAALGAASVGVIGANAAINKDLFFQKTIPALFTQMEANRAERRLAIIQGLSQPDSKYPLAAAYSDLDAYRNAGGIPDAISSISQNAANAKQKTENEIITFNRTAADIKQLPDKMEIQAQVKNLTNPQILKLVKAMDSNLKTRPDGIQRLVKTIDPEGGRLTGDVAKEASAERLDRRGGHVSDQQKAMGGRHC